MQPYNDISKGNFFIRKEWKNFNLSFDYLCKILSMNDTNESVEDYLERILMLKLNGVDELHAIDLAESFNYSKPSVSIALKKLEEKRYVTIDNNNHIFLTENGKEIAKKIYDRHLTITNFFILLGISKENASKDACKIEHDISEETFSKIKEIVNKNTK